METKHEKKGKKRVVWGGGKGQYHRGLMAFHGKYTAEKAGCGGGRMKIRGKKRLTGSGLEKKQKGGGPKL